MRRKGVQIVVGFFFVCAASATQAAQASVFTNWDTGGTTFIYARLKMSTPSGTVLLPPFYVNTPPIPVLTGSVILDLVWSNNYTQPATIPASGSVTIEYGLDGQQVLSSYMQGPPFAFTLDTTKIPDGTHALTIRVVDSTGATYPASRMRTLAQQVLIRNSGTNNGVQKLPVPGYFYQSKHLPPAVDWITYPGSPQRNTAHPYPYRTISPSNDPALRPPNQWYVESLTEARSTLYQGALQFSTTQKGGVVTQYFYPESTDIYEASLPDVQHHYNSDGGRDDNMVDPYSNVTPAPDGSGWVGVDLAGRIFKISHDGSVTTLAGLRPLANVLQYDFKDLSVSPAQIAAKSQAVGTGMSPGQYGSPNDLVFDPRNTSLLYLADTIHHAIWRVDLSKANPAYTLYAGMPDQAGYKNGSVTSAQFNEPYSLAMAADGTMYVADFNNCAIRKISSDGSTVTTLVGMQPGQTPPSMVQVAAAPDTYSSPTPIPFNSAGIPYPQVVRFDSHGNLVEGESVSTVVRLINLSNQTVSRIFAFSSGNNAHVWMWLDVDTMGTIGPKDDILMTHSVGTPGNTSIFRFAEDGSFGINPTLDYANNGSLPEGPGGTSTVLDQSGHYPWFIAISKTEGRFITMGFGNLGVTSWRILQPTDAPPIDSTWQLVSSGWGNFQTGTVDGFPWGARPGFATLHGFSGNGHLGTSVCPTFDDLMVKYPDDASLGAYIQGGMCGSVPRPEFTGNDLRDMIYFIRRFSLQGGSASGSPVKPGADVPDTAAPVISNVDATYLSATSAQVTWTTDKPALGFVAWGSRSDYNGWSPIETGYTTSHSVVMTGLPNVSTLHYVVVAKDIPGLQSNTPDLTLGNPTPPPPGPPQIPINVRATAGAGQITVTWDPVFQATSYNIYWTSTAGDPKTTGFKAGGVNSPFVLHNLTVGVAYTISVTAVNSVGESVESAFVSATPTAIGTPPPPPPPGNPPPPAPCDSTVFPPAPVLASGSFPLNSPIGFSYPSCYIIQTVNWTITPIGSIGVWAYRRHADTPTRKLSGAPSSSFPTSNAQFTPASQNLTLGTYQIQAMVTDNLGRISPPSAIATITLVNADLSSVRVYPNPWRNDKHVGKNVTFDGLTVGTTIKIFTVSGHEVKELHTDAASTPWDLTNDSGDKVASGVYVYLIMDSQGNKVRGKVAVIK